MARIDISESYASTKVSLFTATDNTVLLPIVVINSEFSGVKTKLYETSTDLKKDYSSENVAVYITTGTNTATDDSFAMAEKLLDLGLYVVVKPLCAPERTDSATYDFASRHDIEKFVNDNIAGSAKEEGSEAYTEAYAEFISRNLFNIKFITSGAYQNFKSFTATSELAGYTACGTKMSAVAASRGDAVALIELPFDTSDIISALPTTTFDNAMFSACTYPAGVYDTLTLPGAYGYLATYANSVQTNPNWFAAAGITRGQVPGLTSCLYEVTEATCDILSGILAASGTDIGVSVNPITNFGNYGYRLFGNRTMFRLTASSATGDQFKVFLNVRMLLCDIKKQIYDAATRVTFEPNDDITFINFKTMVNTLLEQMKANRGIEYYKWSAKDKDADKGVLKVDLTIKPIEAVEQFTIGVVVTDDSVTTDEI